MDLRLIVITDRELAAPRDMIEVVRQCLGAGAPAVQLRDKRADARSLYEQALLLRALTVKHGALLFVNDRLDVALAGGADGVHLGPADLPIALARRIAPRPFLIGCSTDDPAAAARAEAGGADYIGCGAVFGTSSKPEAAGHRIGLAGLQAVVRAVKLPVVAIGGIDLENVAQIPGTGAAGVAAIGAVMGAADPGAAVRELLSAFSPYRHGTPR